MVHTGLIYSPYIRKFINIAKTLVFDELHVYEGVLGSHIHQLVHRIKLSKNSYVQFMASSATIGNPREFAESIFDKNFVEVHGMPRRKGSAVHIFVSAGYLSKSDIIASIARFLADENKRFIVFVDCQQLAERLGNIIETKYDVNVDVHRAGLSVDVRKGIEDKLRRGLLNCVIATPTLELGIDIGALDVVVLATLPPSYSKYIQRAGRVGRREKGYIITILGSDPIDAYYMMMPSRFFEQDLTPSYIEPLNEEIVETHVVAYMLQAGKTHVSKIPSE